MAKFFSSFMQIEREREREGEGEGQRERWTKGFKASAKHCWWEM